MDDPRSASAAYAAEARKHPLQPSKKSSMGFPVENRFFFNSSRRRKKRKTNQPTPQKGEKMKASYKLEYDPAEYKNIHDTLQQFIGAGKDVLIQMAQFQHTREMAEAQRHDARLQAEREAEKEEGLSDNDIKIEEMNIDLQQIDQASKDQAREIQLLRQELESVSSILDEESEEENEPSSE
jgi:hypothetical protein